MGADDVSCISFFLAGQEHAISASRLREITQATEITPVPALPPWVRGVTNLRGTVLPVVDLAARFGQAPLSPGKRSCFLVIELEIAGHDAILGLMVDAVGRVLEVRPEDLAPPPSIGLTIAPRFVRGLAKSGDRFVVILDVERLFALEELTELLDVHRAGPRAALGERPGPPQPSAESETGAVFFSDPPDG